MMLLVIAVTVAWLAAVTWLVVGACVDHLRRRINYRPLDATKNSTRPAVSEHSADAQIARLDMQPGLPFKPDIATGTQPKLDSKSNAVGGNGRRASDSVSAAVSGHSNCAAQRGGDGRNGGRGDSPAGTGVDRNGGNGGHGGLGAGGSGGLGTGQGAGTHDGTNGRQREPAIN
jgi:hypothetical protein